MEQQIAIITGGSSGIGFAIAKKFCEENIFTYIIGRDEEKLEKARCAFGDHCRAIAFDVSNLSQMKNLVDRIVAEKGKIDILVNNAGINLKKEMLSVTDEEFQRIMHTNVTSVFSLSREVAQHMKNAGSGSIINISSMSAHYGLPGVIAYTASKSAIEGMTRAMTVELSPHGIRVNCIAPGFIATNMSSTALNGDPERKQKVLSRTPMGRLGDPEDVANMAFFLASKNARFITGSIMTVDGGNSIGF